MIIKKLSYQLVDHVVARDVFSDLGVLLISGGTRLQAHDITLLLEHRIEEIYIKDQISNQFSIQFKDLISQQELTECYLEVLRNLKHLYTRLEEGKYPDLSEIKQAYQILAEIPIRHGYFFLHLNKIKGYDEYTYRHSLNVSIISSIIGKLLGFSQERCDLLGVMGLLHDIGKMRVPSNILFKPGKLSPAEYEVMKAHTIYGYELLKNIEGTTELIQLGALYHHERLDGSGYPDRLVGDQIPIEVQIVSTADIYDAICSDRIYKEKDSSYLAIIELMNEVYNGRLNAQVVLPFVYYLVEAFVGGEATLNNGERAEVVMIHAEEPHRPLIRLRNRYIDLRRERKLEIIELYAK